MEINTKSKLLCFICESKCKLNFKGNPSSLCQKFQNYRMKLFDSLLSEENKLELATQSLSGGDDNQSRNKIISCCAQCATEVETFCEMWEGLESIHGEMICSVVKISNLATFQSKQSPKHCYICLSVPKLRESFSETNSQIDTCLQFLEFATRFVLNTKKPSFNKNISQIFAEIGRTRNECVYCCDICLTEVVTFCEMYEALDSLRLEILRILDRISNRSKHFHSSAEKCRKLSFPRVNLKRLSYPNRQQHQLEVEPENTSLHLRVVDTKSCSKSQNQRKPQFTSADYEGACLFCEKKYKHPCLMERHMRGHTGEKLFMCHICLKECSQNRTLLAHQKICGKSIRTKTKTKLNAHLQSVNKKNHKCDICGKGFPYRSRLQDHKNVHVRQTVRCAICKKTFFSKYEVKMHKRDVHGAIKRKQPLSRPHSYDICGKTFPFPSKLNIHKRAVHDGIRQQTRPYSCDLCGKAFFSQAHLNKHKRGVRDCSRQKRVVSRPYSCDMCGKKFPWQGHLNIHKRAVHDFIGESLNNDL